MIELRALSSLIFIFAATPAGAQTLTPSMPPAPAGPLTQVGFETPDLGTGTPAYAYSPAGSAWTFAGAAGLAANGSAFTSLNPSAPEGDQVAFIQGGPGSVVSQGFTASPGRFRLLLRAAQRKVGAANNNRQTVVIRVDGIEVARIVPPDDTYLAITTDSFLISGTSHTIAFEGINPLGGDHTVFIDDIRLQRISATAALWSSPATWGGTLPGPTSEVVIPTGAVVLLDTAAVVKNMTIHGAVYCADQDISLQAEWVMAHGGRFECGSRTSPMLDDFVFTLAGGDDGDNIMGMGDKFFAGMSGAVIELHGEPRSSWTQLAATAQAGASSLTLLQPVDWRAGEQLVLAPTQDNAAEGEVVQIAAISGGVNVTLSSPLNYRHYGETSSYSNGTTSWTLDERGEVGLLTRNIRIQGDAASENRGFGAHVMTMAGTTIHTSGIELYRVGQKGRLGRYPFHWHLVEHAPGQYIINSSVHRSYNRCVTVHGTYDTWVADNVCYDFIGHGYFLEDGIEQNNIFDHNLGIWARRPNPHEAILETDYRESPASNGPAVFWIGHPDNVYTNNAAAGTEGTGYWYGMDNMVTGPSQSLPGGNINPRTADFGVFDNNRVHTALQGFSSCTGPGGTLGMEPANDEALISRLTATNARQGVWPCSNPMTKQNTRFDRLIVANSQNSMQAPNPMTFENSVFVGYTANAPDELAPNSGLDARAVAMYDQGFLFYNVHFVNYDRPSHAIFEPVGGAHKHVNNRLDGVTFQNSPNIMLDPANQSRVGNGPAGWSDVIHDVSGSLLTKEWAMTSDHPLLWDASCIQPANISLTGYSCPYRYGHFRFDTFVPISDVTILRSDGVRNTAPHIEARHTHSYIADGKYLFSYRLAGGMNSVRSWVQVYNAMPGDTPVFELLDVPSSVFVQSPGWSAATSLTALWGGPGRRWFWRDFSLFVKLSATGQPWHATDLADICLTPTCTGGQVLSLGTLPQVSITAPADSARVPAGNIAVSASATDPDGILSTRLYLDTDLIGTDTTPPYNFTMTGIGAGTYALKLVAEDTNHRTFTAVQQLFVGDGEPRVEITAPLDGQTHAGGTSVTVPFAVSNWPVTLGGRHLHWFVNGVDRGHLFSTAPLVISGLTQGRQEIKIALAEADHTVRAVHAMAMIYIVENGMLADFEDGPDRRGSVRAERFAGPVSEISAAWGTQLPIPSRLDGQDDINWFDFWNNGDGIDTAAVYRMKIDPPQNWSALSAFQVFNGGPPFQAFLIDASAGSSSLGNSTFALSTFSLTGLPATARDQVTAIELRHPEANVPPNTAGRQHIYHFKLLP